MLAFDGGYGVVYYVKCDKCFENGKDVKRPTALHKKLCGKKTLVITKPECDEAIKKDFAKYKAKNGVPAVIYAEGIGVFTVADSLDGAKTVANAYYDAVSVSLGNASELDKNTVLPAGKTGRVANRVVVVTGGAQGFGKGVAEAMNKNGAYVVIADMNYEGAKATAAEFDQALAVGANVSDEQSVADMIRDTVLTYGGIDVFINNASIVRAGSLEEMTKSNFELVTAVNYTAYFLCVKYASAAMKIQRRFAPSRLSDVIEINSKSGLAGSNKNFAYAGSKFGGIGLTQSFALELAPYGIKVNAVCPGNFLEGPLWTDPVRGLLVQYLNAGKVPGAKTTADVLRFYESKVPLGRGCRPGDVAAAILYIIEQEYETGQAIPVTGGQNMLN
ncbi:MAG: SDR family NAD(P)-dependent oxidoreductase [Firmicutes bacterium]|nr:SDR family NAD(P)-dependent oxidoreductase [Candidatus Colimorpha enterica]